MAAPRLCSVPCCGKPHDARGWCKNHYKRWKRHGNPLGGKYVATEAGEPEEYYQNVARGYSGNECLVWPYSRNERGYGVMRCDGRAVIVSRRLCEEVNGKPPTPRHEAAHSCGNGNGGCVTRKHLVWKTPKGNSADKLIHGTLASGERNGRAKLTDAQALEILGYRGKEAQHVTAKRYGVHQSTISTIQNGKRRSA